MGGVSVFAAGVGVLLMIPMMMHGISGQAVAAADPECCVYKCLNDYYAAADPDAGCSNLLGCDDQNSLQTGEDCLNGCNLTSTSTSSCATQCFAATSTRRQGCPDNASRLQANCTAASNRNDQNCHDACFDVSIFWRRSCRDACVRAQGARLQACAREAFRAQNICVASAFRPEYNCVKACPTPTPNPSDCRTQCLAAYYTGSKESCSYLNFTGSLPLLSTGNCFGTTSLRETTQTCLAACSTSSTCPIQT